MKARGSRFWIALFSAASVVLVAVVDMDRTSPGPLTSVHERERDLAGKSNCSECHGGWLSNMTDSCLECHEPVEFQIDGRSGLHGSVAKDKARQCALCHSEHHGASSAIVNKQSFALAGVPDVEAFDHAKICFEMDGAHLDLECAKCHEHANDLVLEKGARRFMGLDQDCATCHEDPHEGRMVVACAACHGQQTWQELHSLGHEKQLPLVGGHAGVSCRDCHAESESHSLEILGAKTDRPPVRECQTCHESPHSNAFAAGAAQLANLSPGASCVVCHEPEHTTFRDERLTMDSAQHAASGFSLALPHDHVECAKCHAPDAGDFHARYPGRGADACNACHADPHGGQFDQGPFKTQDCLACHERERFEPHAFTVEKHELAALPLTGAHIETKCNECHKDPPEGEPRAFKGTASSCDACHEDAHAGFFAPFAAALPPFEHGECARCHDTASFAAVAPERFDHGRWTGFPVLGAHEQSGCDSCHAPAPERDDRGRIFGRVEDQFGRYEGCSTCHEDPHRGEFDGAEHPLAIDGRKDCARCHVESSFRSVEERFDHGLWTGFVLAGAHDAACSACHAPLRRPDELGRTWARALGAGCADCHEDPHAGQFDVRGRNDCSRCHTSEFDDFLDFDHEQDSRFKLGRAHEDLDCSACHLPAMRGDLEFVRFKPLGIECSDCHGVREEVLLRKTPKRR